MSAVLQREELGTLGPDEAGMLPRDEPASTRRLRLQLNDELFEARSMRAELERQVRAFTERPAPFELVQGFANWTAREALTRDRIERMGFGR